ncbi:luciferase family oxidoreductase, group 1 [Bacillus methanolicus PB1]|uniref:Luciferase family oxidoreductase, group 1 n=1 Tax=Bacillus methanolicus PB1 TaxID=997296 RepID=I3E6Z1_BACMT|nr:luciferase family oxidoreductase, group 1 [Bacillus methanolicus PB1]
MAGTPLYVKKVLTNFHKAYQVDEFILHTPLQKVEERIRSFQLLSPIHLIEDLIIEERDDKYVS